MADRGRRPVARENDEGAEYDDGRAGKTNGGFGSGRVVLGDAWAFTSGESCEDVESMRGGTKLCAASCPRPSVGVSTIMSGPIAVAIIPSRSAAPEAMDNSASNGEHGLSEDKSSNGALLAVRRSWANAMSLNALV